MEIGEFAAWARQLAANVVLSDEVARRSARTVNRMLKAVVGFYEFHGRRGMILPGSGRSDAQGLGSATTVSATGL